MRSTASSANDSMFFPFSCANFCKKWLASGSKSLGRARSGGTSMFTTFSLN
jgi:hypothetical protein